MRYGGAKQIPSDTISSSTEQEQQQPSERMSAPNIFKDPNQELKDKRNKAKYCDICTPNGCNCLDNWSNKLQWSDNTEEQEQQQPRESD